jgi:type I restriction enzyme S subunit
LKDGGIIWIGETPAHWKVRRIRHVIQPNVFGIRVGPFGSSLTEAVVSEEYGCYKVYGQANLIRHDFTYGDNFVKEADYNRLKNYEVLPGDVLLSMMGTIGRCAVAPAGIRPGIMDSHLIKIRLSDEMFPAYFEFVYDQSEVVYEQLLLNSKVSIMNGLNSGIVKNIYVPVPPISEQIAIAEFLEAKCPRPATCEVVDADELDVEFDEDAKDNE